MSLPLDLFMIKIMIKFSLRIVNNEGPDSFRCDEHASLWMGMSVH